MSKRYYIFLPTLAVMATACLPGGYVVRPQMPVSVVRAFADTLVWGVTNEAVDSIHGFEINMERDLLKNETNRITNVWETTDGDFGLLSLPSDPPAKARAFTWWGLVPSDICYGTRRAVLATGNLYVRVFRYYGPDHSWYDKAAAGPDDAPEGRWIGEQSSPLLDYTFPTNCTPNRRPG